MLWSAGKFPGFPLNFSAYKYPGGSDQVSPQRSAFHSPYFLGMPTVTSPTVTYPKSPESNKSDSSTASPTSPNACDDTMFKSDVIKDTQETCVANWWRCRRPLRHWSFVKISFICTRAVICLLSCHSLIQKTSLKYVFENLGFGSK